MLRDLKPSRRRSWRFFGFLWVWVPLFCHGACSSESSGSGRTCELDAGAGWVVRSVKLDLAFSSEDCPSVTPEQLNASLDSEEASLCSLQLSNCSLFVQCDFDVAVAKGELIEEQGRFKGNLIVKDPIDCTYQLEVAPD
ncbi:MAG: hypothetical protein RJA70_2942 [Pseudomonadota bacterium]